MSHTTSTSTSNSAPTASAPVGLAPDASVPTASAPAGLTPDASVPTASAPAGSVPSATAVKPEPPAPRAPVADWATDFDHVDPDYAARAPEIWDELRRECPVAHSDRYGGTWLPVTHADVSAVAADTETFSSCGVIVFDGRPEIPPPVGFAPPITSDPPFHRVARQFLLPAFAPKAIEAKRETTRQTCRDLLDELLADVEAGRTDIVDAALGYTQHIPVRVIADMLGVPRSDGEQFRTFIHQIMEEPGESQRVKYEDSIDFYLDQLIAARAEEPQDDLISHMTHSKIAGEPLAHEHVRGTCGLLIVAGVDTTWSAIGASLWHLAQHPVDRQRWLDDPDVRPFAVEEFLRFYAPVTMARLVATDTEFAGCSMRSGDWVLLPFPAANRDPAAFEDADRFVIDRQRNRHSAFGLGIHRCLGSNLARLELTVALEEWMQRVPHFELADPQNVTWSTGQIRGPRRLPVRILDRAA